MRRGDRFPEDQAEVVFSDAFLEQLAGLTEREQLEVIAQVVRLCQDPGGKHPLHKPLAGWNTIEVSDRHRRVVYRGTMVGGAGLIEVLCVAPRSDNAVYDLARGLVDTQLLTDEEATAVWQALAILELAAEEVGLDPWDFAPAPAPVGLQRAAIHAKVVTSEQAAVMTKDELNAALAAGFEGGGVADPEKAIEAAVRVAARRLTESRPPYDPFAARRTSRCGAFMPRAKSRCSRRAGHPGPHRAS